jgi:hypothetical protein
MVEVWLFGVRLLELASGGAVVALLLALSSVTYLGATLMPALPAPPLWARRARAAGGWAAVAAIVVALLGLRVGAPGSGGEALPSLALSVAATGAAAATVAYVMLAAHALAARFAESSSRRAERLALSRASSRRELAAAQRAFLEGRDLQREVEAADHAVARLHGAVERLATSRRDIEGRVQRGEQAGQPADAALLVTRDELATRIETGERVEIAARAAAYRLACSAPVRTLFRRRPRDLTFDVADPRLAEKLARASRDIDRFLAEVEAARQGMLGERSEPPPDAAARDEAMRELGALEDAFGAVASRVSIVTMRLGVRADLDEVASAAGAVSSAARASGVPASDLQDLIDEVSRAEATLGEAISQDLDGPKLSETLDRSLALLGGETTVTLDEVLRALDDASAKSP